LKGVTLRVRLYSEKPNQNNKPLFRFPGIITVMPKTANRSIEISIVVPIWNDAESVQPFLNELEKSILKETNRYEIIFCVDPSQDNTEMQIRILAKGNKKIRALFFASRAGQSASTMAGLAHASGEAIIVIDVDLQDPVELIPVMIQNWRKGASLVLPRRISRSGEPLSKRLTAAIGYAFLNRFGHIPIPKNTGDFRLMDRELVRRILALRETHVFLRGLVAIADQKPVLIDFIRPPRPRGQTKYNKWFGGIRSGMNGIVSFSSALLDWIVILGLALASISFFLGARLAFQKLTGHYVTPGNASLFVVVTFVGGMQLVGIGVIGLYIGRIFEEVKNRPRWYIRESLGIDWTDDLDTARTYSPSRNQSRR
jgi:glycosyltransferase involved in cell wall biosynthesis